MSADPEASVSGDGRLVGAEVTGHDGGIGQDLARGAFGNDATEFERH
jgi:hypothetical protein